MKTITAAVLLVSFCGCVLPPQELTTHPVAVESPDPEGFFRLLTEEQRNRVASITPPIPQKTGFETSPAERETYLKWYAEGYRFGLTGKMVHALWGQFPHRNAVIAGWESGQSAGWHEWAKENLISFSDDANDTSSNKQVEDIRR